MDLLAILEGFNFWSWWIVALALFVIELLAPGVFFLWLGLAAVVTGFIALLLPGLGWQADFAIFAVLGVISAVLGRRYWKPKAGDSADPTLNQRGSQYVGQVYTLQTAIANGHGRMDVADGSWLVSGPDLPAGSKVRVTGVDGAKLKVESA
ncbi:MAG: NfeD family protein [Rhodospirillaceae bacterium]|nr:NfeD family protein [Rhodospirillaceae bacterium]